MIVSLDWLKEYVTVDMPLDELTTRLTMSGLNLEEVIQAEGDIGVDLEVTSNRPDCLGHVGVAREIGVLYGGRLTMPPAEVTHTDAGNGVTVEIECPDLCPRYTARVIRGVKIGPSPDWMQKRLQTVLRKKDKNGNWVPYQPINNVADITNYVLMECGQPLHAFDLDKLAGQRIVVRRANAGEKMMAIDQKEYELTSEMCVIADAERPVAIGGVMGGLDTEIGDGAVNVLIEAADFSPISVRNTARQLHLHSSSSYRFERGIDAHRLDWASRRCCELILELCGGELVGQPVVAGSPPPETPEPIAFHFPQLQRLLGIAISEKRATEILVSLGLTHVETSGDVGKFVPPSWRRDLAREADLIEEVVRIYGYDKIPDNVTVPLELSNKAHRDRVAERIQETLCALGFFEAITLSFVSESDIALIDPHPERKPLRVEHSSRKKDNILRKSLIPSLLTSRRENEKQGNPNACLFEMARVYLECNPDGDDRKVEPLQLGFVGGQGFIELKSIVETIVSRLNPDLSIEVAPYNAPFLVPGRGAKILVQGQDCGWMGELDRSVTDRVNLRDAASAGELNIALLEDVAQLVPHYDVLPAFPTVDRDLNFVLDENKLWQELEEVVRNAAGPLLETVRFGGQYRGEQIPSDKKSYIVNLSYRSSERTLSGKEVDDIQQKVVADCAEKLGAEQR